MPAPPPASATASPSILVVDADERTRESIVGILAIRHRYRVVGSAGDAAAAESLVRRHRPEVVVIDPRLPDASDGVGLIRRMRVIDPDVHILALGWTPSLEGLALRAGAHAFLRKTLKRGDLASAIARCMGDDQPAVIPVAEPGPPARSGPE